MECAICTGNIKKSEKIIAISKDRWTGKLSESPEEVLICHTTCLQNALKIVDYMKIQEEK